MSRQILVLQQVPHEGLGRLYGAIRRAGCVEEVVPCHRDTPPIPDTLAGYAGLIVMGGPMSAHQADRDPTLKRQTALLGEAIERDLPTLGICLGAQLLARATGARIFTGAQVEIGWHPVDLSMESATDPLLIGLPNPLTVFQWHGEGFDLPGGAVHLASSEHFPHQAFRLGNRVYGLQFHLEVEAAMVKEWVAVNAGELATLEDRGEAMVRDAEAGCLALSDAFDQVASRWLSLLEC